MSQPFRPDVPDLGHFISSIPVQVKLRKKSCDHFFTSGVKICTQKNYLLSQLIPGPKGLIGPFGADPLKYCYYYYY